MHKFHLLVSVLLLLLPLLVRHNVGGDGVAAVGRMDAAADDEV